ncbi:MAG: citrate transporter [Ruminococcaceae bacterium]|nr:citrate transporter [Oscillospiraceae bacterium]
MAAPVIAVIIFIAMFLAIVMDKIERHIVTLVSGLLMILIVFGLCMKSFPAIWETLNFQSMINPSFWYSNGESHGVSHGINWETIVFIAGMMIMVEGMGESGFFRWLCLGLAKLVKYKVVPLFIAFMLMSSVLAMFIDSITVILFLASATLELAKILKFKPAPLIIAEIFCANLGGSATMCGDPPNIIIGTSLGYSFFDFILNTGLIALISLPFVMLFFYLSFKKDLKSNIKEENVSYPDAKDVIKNKKDFTVSVIIFLSSVVLLVTHSITGLTVSTIGVFVTVFTLLFAGKNCGVILKKVDYKTLLFFLGLFIVVGGLEQTHILELIAEYIAILSEGNTYLLIGIIIWVSAIASAFVDNIPFAATMIPVIRTLSVSSGVSLDTLAWALSMGTDVGGSATPIGASANVVGISAAAQEGHLIGWGKFCKYLVPATVIVLVISTVIISLRYI